jgi:hypothetical protein
MPAGSLHEASSSSAAIDWRLAWKSKGRVIYDPANWDECTANSAWASCGDNAAIRYDIAGVPYNYYSRVKPDDGFRPYEMMNDCWRSEYSGKPNKIGSDFQMFQTEADLVAKSNPWTHCSNDDCGGNHLVGYPRDCGATAAVAFKWHLIKGSIFCSEQPGFGQGDVSFYISVCGGWTPPLCGGLGWQVVLVLLGIPLVYLVGGILFNKQWRGNKGAEALPHRSFWLFVHGLVLDGMAFSRPGGQQRRAGRNVTRGATAVYASPPDSDAPLLQGGARGEGSKVLSLGKEKSSKTKSKKRSGKSKQSSHVSSPAKKEPCSSSEARLGGAACETAAARALLEQRDTTVHSSQAKVIVTSQLG